MAHIEGKPSREIARQGMQATAKQQAHRRQVVGSAEVVEPPPDALRVLSPVVPN